MAPTDNPGHLDPDPPPLTPSSDHPSNSSGVPLLKPAIAISLIFFSLLLLHSLLTRPIPLAALTRRQPSSSSSCPQTPATTPTTLSHIVFALAGSAATWHRRRQYSELWWSNATAGFVWLDEPPPANLSWPPTSPPFRVSRPDPTRDRRPSDRIARLVKHSIAAAAAAAKDEVRWFVMGDDDTVFFKENVAAVLGRYDHRRMWYVGGVSESVEQDELHSYRTAFGGGGFAVSAALACELEKMMDGCVMRYSNFYGSDEKVSACVGELGVALTRESGFHQLDIRGDPYGLLAAHPVAPLLSLHHLDYVEPLFPHRTQLESLTALHRAYRLDPARILQQSICYDRKRKWSVSVSWGYSVQLYPSLVPARQLELPLQTFRTWRSWSEGPFVFNTRPVKPDPCDRPVVYFLDWAVETGGGNRTLSSYKRAELKRRDICTKTSYKYALGVEKITVVASKMDPQEWSRAPRRQCCEFKSSWGMSQSLHVVVRGCRPGETISP